jgi:antimicrobial peptide system SdpA family protein
MLGAATALLGALTATLAAYAIHGSMPYNAVHLPYERELAIRVWLPEAWKFFTADARAETVAPFARDVSGAWSVASFGANGEAANAFGLDRKSRAQGVEMGLLLERVAADAWSACSEPIEACLEMKPPAERVNNVLPRPTLCGRIGFVRAPPVPWSWSRAKPRLQMPSHVVVLEVSC